MSAAAGRLVDAVPVAGEAPDSLVAVVAVDTASVAAPTLATAVAVIKQLSPADVEALIYRLKPAALRRTRLDQRDQAIRAMVEHYPMPGRCAVRLAKDLAAFKVGAYKHPVGRDSAKQAAMREIIRLCGWAGAPRVSQVRAILRGARSQKRQ